METKLYAMVWKAKGESDSEWRVSWKIYTDIDFMRQLKTVEDIREQDLDHAIVEIRFVPETEADPQFEPFPTSRVSA